MDKEQFKLKLLSVLKAEEEKAKELRELTKPIAPENAIGRVSRMDAINNKSINEAALRNTETKVTKLKIALERINDEGFGLCARCGQPIPEGRLLLMPQSNRCVHCADK